MGYTYIHTYIHTMEYHSATKENGRREGEMVKEVQLYGDREIAL